MNVDIHSFAQDADSSSSDSAAASVSASAALPAPTLPQLNLSLSEEPAHNSMEHDMDIMSTQVRVTNWLADVHLSPPTSSPPPIDDIDIDLIPSTAATLPSQQSRDTMPKRSRQLSGSPALGTADPGIAPPSSPSPNVDDEVTRKKRRILEQIATQTAVDPSDQLRTDQLAFIPRSYQLELAQIAKSGNVLVCLDTGSGKTLISVLLLQHMHQQPLPPTPTAKRKVSFFLVNLVPLVHQQSSVIAGNSDLAVGKLYGELKEATRGGRNKLTVDNWQAPQWSALLESHQVIVSTAQCFLDALIHGFIKMDDLNLIVFDEVHHALKNHPFFRIMKYYRLAPADQRPKIFGMTASPIFTRSGMFHEAAHYLQHTMDATIHTVSKAALDDLDKVKQKPDELVVEFAPFVSVFDDEIGGVQLSQLSREMLDMFAADPILDDEELDPVARHFRDEVQPKLEYTMRHLGAIGCDVFWHSTLLELRSRARKWAAISRDKRTLVSDAWIVDASMRNPTAETGAGDDSAEESQKPTLPLGAAHLSTNSELNRRILLHMRAQPALPDELSIDADNASPKLLRLIELLRCFEPDAANFCAIVFVERRQTATLLVELIKRVPGLGFIHPEFLLGHDNGSAAGGAPAMDWHDQVQVLNRFRRRAPTNLLVATSIAEEGLDIQAANLVIRFDLFNRHISFLQSRGRARARGSRFILMAESGNAEHAQVILNAFDTEARRSKWLDAITESGADDDAMLCEEWQQRLRIEPEDPDVSPAIHEPATGARLYAEDAPSLVAHYAATLHSEYLEDAVLAYRIESTEVMGGTPSFTCTLELPSTAAVRSVESGPCTSKKRAKRMAAFRACQQLRELGELDEWLMPKLVGASVDDRDAEPVAMNPHHKAWRGTGQPIYVPVKKMDGWARFHSQTKGKAEAQVWYATLLPLNSFDPGRQSLVLLTRGPLPSTERLTLYHAASGEMKTVRAASLGAVALGPSDIEAATQFTRFVFALLSRRELGSDDGEPVVLVAPVRIADGVADVTAFAQIKLDWPESLQSTRIDVSTRGLESLGNKVLTRRHGYASNALYIFQSVRSDLSALSPLPPKAGTEAVEGEGERQTYLSQHLTKYARRVSGDEAACLAAQLADSPLVAVTKLAKVTNLLTAPSRGSRPAATPERFVIPRFYSIFPLRADTLSSMLLLPSILTRYDHLLLASQCSETIFGGVLAVDIVLEALASPAARCGLDYERLEFLGDTFLKLVATCHTFTTQLGRTEAELHLANKAILTNVRLLREARRLELARFALFASADFAAKRFTPPVSGWIGGSLTQDGAVEVEGGGEVDVIREKTLPDVVEALIGAALVGSGIESALHVCRILTLIPPTIARFEDFNTLLEDLKLTSVTQGWERRVDRSGLDHLQGLFGHVYRYPHLGLEAFTHPSLLASVLPSYQRLEFLGDAWLDLYIVRYIYTAHPSLTPGELTALKGMLASNSTLAALGHRLGLHKYIASNSEVLVSSLSAYSSAVEAAGTGVAYWQAVGGVPKALADVVEASFASIVVDSAFSPSVAEGVFDRIFVPFYSQFCPWDNIPLTDLKRLLLSTSCRLEITSSLLVGEDVDLVEEMEVSIRIHGTQIAQYKNLPTSIQQVVKAKTIVETMQAKQREEQSFWLHQLVRTLAWKRPFQQAPEQNQPTLKEIRAITSTCNCT